MVEKQGKVTTEWNQSLAIKTLEEKNRNWNQKCIELKLILRMYWLFGDDRKIEELKIPV